MPPDFRPRSVSLYTIHVISVKVYLLKKSLSDKKTSIERTNLILLSLVAAGRIFDVTCGYYERESWPAGSNRLIVAGDGGGVRVFAYRKIHAIQPSGLFLTIFLTWHVPTSKIRRSACYGLKLLWHAKLQKMLPLGVKTEFWHNSGTVTGDNV